MKVAVNGSEGFWLRGQLTQPLPADPEKALPEVERVRISSTVDRALTGSLRPSEPYAAQAVLALVVADFSLLSSPVPLFPTESGSDDDGDGRHGLLDQRPRVERSGSADRGGHPFW